MRIVTQESRPPKVTITSKNTIVIKQQSDRVSVIKTI